MSPLDSDTSSAANPWPRSHLFTVRAWYEQIDPERREVRLQLRHVLTGETRYFHDWQAPIEYMEGKLAASPDLFDSP
jgi:hypothetical protein